jgi:hypothetical protein
VKGVFLLIRGALGAVFGFFTGGLIGSAAIIVAIIVTGSTFGLANIRGPVLDAALIGALAGCFIPAINRRLLEPWFDFLIEKEE